MSDSSIKDVERRAAEKRARDQARFAYEVFGVGVKIDTLQTMEAARVPLGDAPTVTYDSASNLFDDEAGSILESLRQEIAQGELQPDTLLVTPEMGQVLWGDDE